MRLIISSAIIAFAILFLGICGMYVGKLFAQKGDVITVNGTAERHVTSDAAQWNITVRTEQVPDRKRSNEVLAVEVKKIVDYLKSKGITDASLGSVSYTQICPRAPESYYEDCSLGVLGYIAEQSLAVATSDVNLVAELAGTLTTTFPEMNLYSYAQYYYNELKSIRADMLSEATRNARERAESVAEAGGADIGKITSLSSGVFQVTAVNSVDFDDDYGSYDTSAVDKKITATVKANFSVE